MPEIGIQCTIEQDRELRVHVAYDPDVHQHIAGRLIRLGHITANQVKSLLKVTKVQLDGMEKPMLLYNSYRPIWIGRMGAISRRLSGAYTKLRGCPPPVFKYPRTNAYTERDFDEFGDELIEKYIALNPLSDWKIDWEYLERDGAGIDTPLQFEP